MPGVALTGVAARCRVCLVDGARKVMEGFAEVSEAAGPSGRGTERVRRALRRLQVAQRYELPVCLAQGVSQRAAGLLPAICERAVNPRRFLGRASNLHSRT